MARKGSRHRANRRAIKKQIYHATSQKELVHLQCSSCGCMLDVPEGNRAIIGRTVLEVDAQDVYCIPCLDAHIANGKIAPQQGEIPMCANCGSIVELAPHGGFIVAECPKGCRTPMGNYAEYYTARFTENGLEPPHPPKIMAITQELLRMEESLADEGDN